tara:strand:- start:179 stop:664 length:486 start_codon:yes stop_codon:yes gene_type:complete
MKSEKFTIYTRITGHGCACLGWAVGDETGEKISRLSYGGGSSSLFYHSLEGAVTGMIDMLEDKLPSRSVVRFERGWAPWEGAYMDRERWKEIESKRKELEETVKEGDYRAMSKKADFMIERARIEGILAAYTPMGSEEKLDGVFVLIDKYSKESTLIVEDR